MVDCGDETCILLGIGDQKLATMKGLDLVTTFGAMADSCKKEGRPFFLNECTSISNPFAEKSYHTRIM